MRIYKVILEGVIAREVWLIRAASLLSAFKKAEQKRKSDKSFCRGWTITRVELVGELIVD